MHAVHAAGSQVCTAVSVLPIQRGESSHMKKACGFRTGAILGLVTYFLFQIMNWIQFVPIYRDRSKGAELVELIHKNGVMGGNVCLGCNVTQRPR